MLIKKIQLGTNYNIGYDLNYFIHRKEDWKEINLKCYNYGDLYCLYFSVFFKISTMNRYNYFYNQKSLS